MALSLCSSYEEAERFYVPGIVNSDWGFRGEGDLALLWKSSQSTREIDNTPGLTILPAQGWTSPGQTLALGPIQSDP